ncbi:MAG: peroxidase family protein, partial [Verrucomicrobiota bacterium]
GQFLDHDIDETPAADPEESFDIDVPAGDPHFDPNTTGQVVIPLNRSAFDEEESGPRQQINAITAFIDASNVYGSDDARATALRTLDGSGMLKTTTSLHGPLLPFNEAGLHNAPSDDPSFYLAGDVRANEQIALLAMHTLFVREHNYWARSLKRKDPSLSGEDLYEMARVIVGAEMQAITYREFLPVLLGPRALRPYRGYQSDVNAGIANVFTTAAFRVGHTMLPEEILRLDRSESPIPAGNLVLADAFFVPSEVTEHGISPILRGLSLQFAQEIDTLIIDAVRNFLFGPPGAGGFDLASLNLQRGRDHGLPSYNEVRASYGLPAIASLETFPASPDVQEQLAAAYDSIDLLDPWIAMLAERHVPGSVVGPTIHAILSDQFARLRDGDRYFYKKLHPQLVDLVEKQTLSVILQRNTRIGNEISSNVFLVPDGMKPRKPTAKPKPRSFGRPSPTRGGGEREGRPQR